MTKLAPSADEVAPQISEIDDEIRTLQFQLQMLDSLELLQSSIEGVKKALAELGKDLKPDTITFSDLFEIKTDKDGNVSVVPKPLDPTKLDLAGVPADLAANMEALQKALEELFNPFAAHNSNLLKFLKKLQSSLAKGSDMAKKVTKAITRLEQAWSLFETLLDEDLTADELVDAFDNYFSGLLDILSATLGKFPPLKVLLEFYAKAIKQIALDLKKLSRAKESREALVQSERAIALGRTSEETDESAPPTPRETIESRIEELNDKRWELLTDQQREQTRSARKEVDGLVAAAEERVRKETGHLVSTAEDVLKNYLADQEGLLELWGQVEELKDKRNEALGELIREHRDVLQPWDYDELLNRFPQLEPVVDEIRGQSPAASSSVPLGSGGALSGVVGALVNFARDKPAQLALGFGAVAIVGGGIGFLASGGDAPNTGAGGSRAPIGERAPIEEGLAQERAVFAERQARNEQTALEFGLPQQIANAAVSFQDNYNDKPGNIRFDISPDMSFDQTLDIMGSPQSAWSLQPDDSVSSAQNPERWALLLHKDSPTDCAAVLMRGSRSTVFVGNARRNCEDYIRRFDD